MRKKIARSILALTLLLLIVFPISASAATANFWEGATAYIWKDQGSAVQFTGNTLTAVANANVLNGSYKSITIRLVYDAYLFPPVLYASKTIYPDGQNHTIFQDLNIDTNKTYRFQYFVNSGYSGDTATVSLGASSYTK